MSGSMDLDFGSRVGAVAQGPKQFSIINMRSKTGLHAGLFHLPAGQVATSLCMWVCYLPRAQCLVQQDGISLPSPVKKNLPADYLFHTLRVLPASRLCCPRSTQAHRAWPIGPAAIFRGVTPHRQIKYTRTMHTSTCAKMDEKLGLSWRWARE